MLDRTRLHASLLVIFLSTLAFTLPAKAQMRGKMGDRAAPPAEGREGDLKATGLTPAFPADHTCEPISSGFASPYRYDGSRRPANRNSGLHGGTDITLKVGTPLLAIASGKVIAKGAGGQMEGNFLWLQHAPEHTGFPFWVHSKYQHLAEVPVLNIGDSVRAGQAIALAGGTGTAGGHYGAAGYPHLHLTTHIGPSGEFELAGAYHSMIRARDAQNSDLLLLFLQSDADRAAPESLPEERKRVPIAIVGAGGSIRPSGSKVVWPVVCQAKGG